jgi:hypothetical protein
MKSLNIIRSAFRALRRNKMRSFLTMLGSSSVLRQ